MSSEEFQRVRFTRSLLRFLDFGFTNGQRLNIRPNYYTCDFRHPVQTTCLVTYNTCMRMCETKKERTSRWKIVVGKEQMKWSATNGKIPCIENELTFLKLLNYFVDKPVWYPKILGLLLGRAWSYCNTKTTRERAEVNFQHNVRLSIIKLIQVRTNCPHFRN